MRGRCTRSTYLTSRRVRIQCTAPGMKTTAVSTTGTYSSTAVPVHSAEMSGRLTAGSVSYLTLTYVYQGRTFGKSRD